jgi:hypothetical protein
MRATSSSWKHLPAPEERQALGFEALFTDAEAEQMMLGLVPAEMEDKWFIYFADGWLRFHRSWTGALIYALRLDGSPVGVRVVESWVNRNPQQYAGTDVEYDRKLIRFLIEAFLLKRPDIRFPMPPGMERAPKGVVQHSYVGRAYPESKAEGPSSNDDA